MKKQMACILALVMLCGLLTACSAGTAGETDSKGGTTAPATAGNTQNADPAPAEGVILMEDTRNQDGIGENELLIVSFGTSYYDSRREDIGAIEDALTAEFYENWSARRAFTSQTVIDIVQERDGLTIDSLNDALGRAAANGVRNLVLQPTHLLDGFEYNEIYGEIMGWTADFEQIAIGFPLLTTEEDFNAVADAIVEATKQYDDGETAICFMGHGTEAAINSAYEHLQETLDGKGMENYFIGTVEAYPAVEDVLGAVQQGSYKRVVLRPLMVVAGDHANNDMAGDEEDSWKSIFEAAGYEVECVIEGLGRLEAIQQIYIAHAQEAIDSLEQ